MYRLGIGGEMFYFHPLITKPWAWSEKQIHIWTSFLSKTPLKSGTSHDVKRPTPGFTQQYHPVTQKPCFNEEALNISRTFVAKSIHSLISLLYYHRSMSWLLISIASSGHCPFPSKHSMLLPSPSSFIGRSQLSVTTSARHQLLLYLIQWGSNNSLTSTMRGNVSKSNKINNSSNVCYKRK